jgi:hypothetical protein
MLGVSVQRDDGVDTVVSRPQKSGHEGAPLSLIRLVTKEHYIL